MEWTPFEDRSRPPQLGRVVLALDRMKRIEIVSDDEEAIGVIFAWLLAQALLAREEPIIAAIRAMAQREGDD